MSNFSVSRSILICEIPAFERMSFSDPARSSNTENTETNWLRVGVLFKKS